MSHIRPLHWNEIERVLFKLGYYLDRQKGSHRVYCKSGVARHVTVPQNREIPRGTCKSIARQMGMELKDLMELVEKGVN